MSCKAHTALIISCWYISFIQRLPVRCTYELLKSTKYFLYLPTHILSHFHIKLRSKRYKLQKMHMESLHTPRSTHVTYSWAAYGWKRNREDETSRSNSLAWLHILYLGGRGYKKQVKWYNTVLLLNLNLTVSVQLLFVASVASLHFVVAPMSAVRHPVDPLGWMVVPSVSTTVWQSNSQQNHPFVI